MISYGNKQTTRRAESAHDSRVDGVLRLAGLACMLLAHLGAVPAAGQLLAGLDEPLVDNQGAIEHSMDGQAVRPLLPNRPSSPASVMNGSIPGLSGSPRPAPVPSPVPSPALVPTPMTPTTPMTALAPTQTLALQQAATMDPRLRPGTAGVSPWLFGGQYGPEPTAQYSADPFRRDPLTTPSPVGHRGLRHTIDSLTLGMLRPPQGRYQEIGQPLVRESWRYRPFSAGWFMGSLNGDVIKHDWLGMKDGFLGGYRLGLDYDHYWGCEMRFSFASVELTDSWQAVQAQLAADALAGIDPASAWGRRFDERRDADVRMWDIDILYYPWGDTAWRPYFLLGLGTGRIDSMDRLGTRRIKREIAMPLAIGLKYRATDRVALRFEFADNIIFGSGHSGQPLHNLSLTGGVELRFGGSRKAYWPYNPGRHYW